MIKEPIVLEVAKDTYVINLMGQQSPALIVGSEKALLMDTGLGNFNLMPFIRKITEKPVILALSHAHNDHMGGIAQFKDIYVHPADKDTVIDFSSTLETQSGISQTELIKQGNAIIESQPDNVFIIPSELVTTEHCEHIYHGHFGAFGALNYLVSDSIELLDSIPKILEDILTGTNLGKLDETNGLCTRSFNGVQLYWNQLP